MNVVVLVLQILGILILAVLLLLAIFLLLPAGIEAFWKEQKAEIWLSVGPLRRRFYPPRAKRETEKKQSRSRSLQSRRKKNRRSPGLLFQTPRKRQSLPPRNRSPMRWTGCMRA